MYQTRLHVLHKHGWLFMQHQNIEFKHIQIKNCNALVVMTHRLMHFSKLLMKSASIQTGSLRHMTNTGHRRFSAKKSEMQITSYLLRYLLQAETLVQQAIKQSRAEQRERHFLSHLLLIVFHTQKPQINGS